LTIKNIINIAWAVIILLYNWLSAMYWTPGPLNSNLIKTEKAVPNNPENIEKIKYSVPISLALEDNNHLSVQSEILDFNLLTGRVRDSLISWLTLSVAILAAPGDVVFVFILLV
jgi:hypothetical protein